MAEQGFGTAPATFALGKGDDALLWIWGTCQIDGNLAWTCEKSGCAGQNRGKWNTEADAQILEYIERHYFEDITLEALAQSASVSKSECLRCFKTTMQDTPYRYLIEYRLQRATDLLRNTDLPIGQIAQAVGFQSQSHFGKLFKERTGYTPKQYRETA